MLLLYNPNMIMAFIPKFALTISGFPIKSIFLEVPSNQITSKFGRSQKNSGVGENLFKRISAEYFKKNRANDYYDLVLFGRPPKSNNIIGPVRQGPQIP